MAALAPLPVTVIGGYLGAGKTSLVNHLLRHAGGRRLMILVNDFGAVNIDAELLESAGEDTIALSNGCVCCTLGDDLFRALGAAIDRRPRPDALVIEASGVADPAKIAQAALAERELRFGGIVALADAANLARLLADPRVGGQAAGQIRAGDLVALTRTDIADGEAARALLAPLTDAPVIDAPHGAMPAELILDAPERRETAAPAALAHPAYASWSGEAAGAIPRAGLDALLADPPRGLYRLKGRVRLPCRGVEVHLVGRTLSTTAIPQPARTRLVAIGPAGHFDPEEMERRWRGLATEPENAT